MTRQNRIQDLIRGLALSADRFAAAAALHDPSLLLRLRAAGWPDQR